MFDKSKAKQWCLFLIVWASIVRLILFTVVALQARRHFRAVESRDVHDHFIDYLKNNDVDAEQAAELENMFKGTMETALLFYMGCTGGFLAVFCCNMKILFSPTPLKLWAGAILQVVYIAVVVYFVYVHKLPDLCDFEALYCVMSWPGTFPICLVLDVFTLVFTLMSLRMAQGPTLVVLLSSIRLVVPSTGTNPPPYTELGNPQERSTT